MTRASFITACFVLLLLAGTGCDRSAVFSAEPSARAGGATDEPRAGPLHDTYDAAAAAEYEAVMARLHATWFVPAERTRTTSAGRAVRDEVTPTDELRFLAADTRVEIVNIGQHSDGSVTAYSKIDKSAIISHEVEIRMSSRTGVIPFSFSTSTGIFDRRELTTQIPITGIDCASGTTVDANTRHNAGGMWFKDVAALSHDNRSCGNTAACGPTAQPITVDYNPDAPPPSDSGGCSGEGDPGDLPPGSSCHSEYLYVEVSYDDGMTWSVIWEGIATVCE